MRGLWLREGKLLRHRTGCKGPKLMLSTTDLQKKSLPAADDNVQYMPDLVTFQPIY